jgi:hypothetical protein
LCQCAQDLLFLAAHGGFVSAQALGKAACSVCTGLLYRMCKALHVEKQANHALKDVWIGFRFTEISHIKCAKECMYLIQFY